MAYKLIQEYFYLYPRGQKMNKNDNEKTTLNCSGIYEFLIVFFRAHEDVTK